MQKEKRENNMKEGDLNYAVWDVGKMNTSLLNLTLLTISYT